MELEGVQRGLANIAEEELQVSHLVTDRHSQKKSTCVKSIPKLYTGLIAGTLQRVCFFKFILYQISIFILKIKIQDINV